MSDKHTPEQRRFNMQQIKGTNTKPEILLRRLLFSKGFRYRINNKNLPGKPDIVLKKYKTVIFVNGCFWHGHENCRYYVIPKTRTEFWTDKINGNKKRDKKNTELLIQMGWKVITVWECELKKDKVDQTIEKLINELHDNLLA
ncbi:very short patch repair endonuclease [Chryseobacterium arthrosphaerae]|uniref:Very short patch repair endonuclease n=1 Tax=Chryseobacterium arthrosphaerae TaxID=651561 RepID=A0A1B8ZV22_9FLAO|nr:very short patch repair endonuclease [Chryseobacterium arthrosphaerae]OCA75431.1 very short patch repair endonuclease [Chryseobacterium arthrosphaerae]